MKVKITMSGSGGELDSKTVENISDHNADELISEAVEELVGSVIWSVGDTLTITEID